MQTIGWPALAAVLLFGGAFIAMRTAGSGRSSRPSKPVTPKERRPKREPAPVAGGAYGLLESIPSLERVRGRGAGFMKLVVGILVISTILAVSVYGIGRGIAWVIGRLAK